MLRIRVEKLKSGYDVPVLQIASFPSYKKMGNSYYLLDFLEISDEELNRENSENGRAVCYATIKLIEYWLERIDSATLGKEIFLPFDFQDEYIGGLLLKNLSDGFRIKVVYSDSIYGWEISKLDFDGVVSDRDIAFIEEEELEWLIGHSEVYEGLEWSIKELLKDK